MVEKVTNRNPAELYGLGGDFKVADKEKPAPTRTEAAELKAMGEKRASGPQHYQLEGPQAPAAGSQAGTVAKLMDVLAPTLNLMMETMNKAISGEKADAKSESVSQALTLLTLLYQVSKLSRQQQVTQRQIAVEANVSSLKSQAAELNNSAKALMAMAIVSGIMAGFTAIMGAVGTVKAGKRINNESAGNKAFKNQQANLDSKMAEIKDTKGFTGAKAKRGEMHKEANAMRRGMDDIKADTTRQGRKFDKQMSKNQGLNAVLQALGQMANSVGNQKQTEAQARGKEDEIQATRAQAAKQKADENIGFQDGMLKELRDMFRSISDSENQAWRASAPTV
ncbi:type III secretion system translocon subunit VopD [Vibrio bivalvicida]|uniref:Translocator protein PopD n=1 Tax=Vibrio bivalvicida TaxID=1276888 RepID=A0A177XTW3_9VIBR|nr:type III secretion system translocon subunit VopD [Vibrio bivalvicida]OAJ92063.1 translocator protein PopD [Vibrio bivalvicida]